MVPDIPVEWHDFCVAAGGAAAALLGLVFVALSINLSRILAFQELPRRAAETIIVLAAALIAALLMLIPGHISQSLGLCVLFVAAPAWALPTWWQIRSLTAQTYQMLGFGIRRLVLHQIATLPFVAASVLLIADYPVAGLYWLAAGIIGSIVIAIVNSWVLLVEIMR